MKVTEQFLASLEDLIPWNLLVGYIMNEDSFRRKGKSQTKKIRNEIPLTTVKYILRCG